MSYITEQAVRDYSERQGTDYVVLLMIAAYVNQESDLAYPSITTIARVSHIGGSEENKKRRVKRVLTRLIQCGDLVVIPQSGHVSMYAIPLYPGEMGYNPQECGEEHDCNRWHTLLPVRRERSHYDQADTRKKAAKRQLSARKGVAPRPPVTPGVAPAPLGGGAQATPGVAPAPLGGGAQATQYKIDSLSEENRERDDPPSPSFDFPPFSRWLDANWAKQMGRTHAAQERDYRDAQMRARSHWNATHTTQQKEEAAQ